MAEMKMTSKKSAKGTLPNGSALILTVVLTSLLAIVGVLFIMMARVNKIASSGLSENKELDAAVETIIAKISQELALDVPHGDPSVEYYDYPGSKDKWLASLEPYQDGTVYKWRQISDVTGFLNDKNFDTQDVSVDPPGSSKYINDYPKITLDTNGELDELWADADGDGIADSKWIEVNDITSSKGEPVYAAIRIIDNGGMINVNTAYKFDPTEGRERIDGSSQMQINLMGLSERDQTHTSQQKIDRLWSLRAGSAPNDISSYEQNVVWQYGDPTGGYIPFDISDEMKLRNRYLLNYNKITTRIEKLWTNAYDGGPEMPLPTDEYTLSRWLDCATFDLAAPNDYDYRHISTTYNMDRIINPVGKKMVNVNRINDINDVNSLYEALLNGLDPCLVDVDKIAAQIAVNLKDYRDADSDITSFVPDINGPTYYGFERPCIYISEMAHNSKKVIVPGGTGPTPGIPYIIYSSYAIELYNPYPEDYPDPNQWRLMIGDQDYDVNWLPGEQFYVILNNNPNAPLTPFDPGVVVENPVLVFKGDDLIKLQRRVVDDVWITVDAQPVPGADDTSGWLVPDLGGITPHSIQRDITLHKCIRRLWAGAAEASTPTLGSGNGFQYAESPDVYIQAHPANTDFTNIGEIGMVFRKSAYSQGPNPIEPLDTEADVRVDLAKPEFQQVFNYLTVFDPANDGIDNDGDGLPDSFDFVGWEWKIPGRININTAPWYVIAQLPWMQYEDSNVAPRAKAISDYRDDSQGFWSIGELMLVGKIRNLGVDGKDNWNGDTPKGPDFTYDDALDDFEERDLIFARISNLVTVRSDVFTAYILVRIGTDGPQKRVIAILDRSDVYSPTDRVKIVAVNPVPDPR